MTLIFSPTQALLAAKVALGAILVAAGLSRRQDELVVVARRTD